MNENWQRIIRTTDPIDETKTVAEIEAVLPLIFAWDSGKETYDLTNIELGYDVVRNEEVKEGP